ncbi:MAG: ABC transporter permease [Acidobacteria bacterium]|jgi:lipopolysaccharide transport system permease protein|nr:ABC transporter permease [Acidobacteriota bacterium]
MAAASARTTPLLIIEAGKGRRQFFRDLWNYRELFLFLSWRDILVRYKQAVLGMAWSLLRPLLTIAVFSLVFGRLAKLPSAGIPYPVLVFAAMLPWQLFAGALGDSSNSLLGNTHLISKIYFPRLIIPVSSVMVNLLDFLISLALLLVLMAGYGYLPDARILFVPIFLLLALLLALGCGFWFSALNVKYRDFRYIVPFVVQFGLYISPVGFSSAVIPERWRLLYSLNPLVGIIDGFRWSLLRGKAEIYWAGFWLSLLLILLVFASGLIYFRRTERYFADVI